MTLTVLDVLRATREYAADPDHIVVNPGAVYETSDGAPSEVDEAVRGCVVGIFGIVCRILQVSDSTGAGREALDRLDRAGWFSETMQAGHAAVLAHIDRAIAGEAGR